MGRSKCFLALPSYGGIEMNSMFSTWHCIDNTPESPQIVPVPSQSSDMDQNYTNLLCICCNAPEPFDYFAMLHSDVAPFKGWLDVLVKEMDAVRADVLSAVIPIKSKQEGLTSTGVGHAGSRLVRRLTMTEVFELPATFNVNAVPKTDPEHYLAVNVGCVLWKRDAARDWWRDFARKGGFRHEGWVGEDASGVLTAHSFPEDWAFSKWAYAKGLAVYATRKVPLQHYGVIGFHNVNPWGDWKNDQDFRGY